MYADKLYKFLSKKLVGPKMSVPNLSGPEFVKLMEQYGIRPKDLGITSNYKCRLAKGERKPSKELIMKLMKIIESKRSEGVGVVDRPGFEPGTSRMPTARSSRLSYRPTITFLILWGL